MIIYFLAITYGIYFATMFDFILYNRSLIFFYNVGQKNMFYKGRTVWSVVLFEMRTDRIYAASTNNFYNFSKSKFVR